MCMQLCHPVGLLTVHADLAPILNLLPGTCDHVLVDGTAASARRDNNLFAMQGLAQGTISFIPGQSRPVLTVNEEPPIDGSDAHTASDGDADDEGAGPSRLGPRFKQRTIDFAAASVRVRAPAGTVGAVTAAAAQTLVIVTDVTRDPACAATDAPPAEAAATGAADPRGGAAPAKRRRRKRRDADQQPASKSTEDAPAPDPEADAVEVPEPKVDPKQRTICFAAARPRAAQAARPPAGVAPGEEAAAANPVDLTAPSPCDEDHAAPAAGAETGQAAHDDVPADVGARPQKKRQRKRSKVEQPVDAGSCEDIMTGAPAPSRAAPAVDRKQRTLTFAGARPRAAPAEGGAPEQLATNGRVAADLYAPGTRSVADAPAGPDVASSSVPAVPAAGPSTATQPSAASLTEKAPPKPPKRACRKRNKHAADAAVPATDPNAQQSVEAVLCVPTAAGPQPDPGQRKICFAAARPRTAASAVLADGAGGETAGLPPAAPRLDDGQSAPVVVPAQQQSVVLPSEASCAVQHEVAEAPESLPDVRRDLAAEVCTV